MAAPAPEQNPSAPPPPESATPTPPTNGKRNTGLLVIAGLVAIGITIAFLYWLHSRHFVSTDDAFIDGHVVRMGAQVAGQVVAVHVDNNREVREGDLLVEIDPAPFEAQLAAARARLAVAMAARDSAAISVGLTSTTSSSDVDVAAAGVHSSQAQLAGGQTLLVLSDAAIRAQEASLHQEQAAMAAAEAEATRAGRDLQRFREMSAQQVVSSQEMDQVRATARSASAQLEAARQQVHSGEAFVAISVAGRALAGQMVNQREADVVQSQARLNSAGTAPQRVAIAQAAFDSARAAVNQASAEVRQAEINLEHTRITAPQDGRVTNKSVEAGSYVQEGQLLFAIVPEEIWVTANFKETQLTLMRPGQPAEIEVDAYPGVIFHGHVDSIQSGTGARFSLLPPENATGNFVKVVQRVPVKIVFDDPPGQEHFLAPGMSVVPTVRVR